MFDGQELRGSDRRWVGSFFIGGGKAAMLTPFVASFAMMARQWARCSALVTLFYRYGFNFNHGI